MSLVFVSLQFDGKDGRLRYAPHRRHPHAVGQFEMMERSVFVDLVSHRPELAVERFHEHFETQAGPLSTETLGLDGFVARLLHGTIDN